MKKWHDIIIYGNPKGGLPTEQALHDYAKSCNLSSIKILYYGLAVKGKCWDTKGTFNKDANHINSKSTWKKVMTKRLGEVFGVACLYDFNEASKSTKIFTFGDKRKTVNHFNAELVGNVKSVFSKDLSGTGIPQEFAIDSNTVKVKLTKDGKARLCFAVHMKSSKKDFADVKLQTKINELRKEISFKYGVDIDIVDIRSTIEYV